MTESARSSSNTAVTYGGHEGTAVRRPRAARPAPPAEVVTAAPRRVARGGARGRPAPRRRPRS